MDRSPRRVAIPYFRVFSRAHTRVFSRAHTRVFRARDARSAVARPRVATRRRADDAREHQARPLDRARPPREDEDARRRARATMDAPRRPSGGGDDDDATTARATTTTGASDGSEKYVSAATRARLRARGIDALNAMQLAVCEAAVGRRADATCRAPTGSGKTLAYVLPIAKMLERAARDGSGGGGGGGAVRAMVVTPTRELASQVRTQCERYCGEGSSALCVGGASAKAQEDAIRKGGAKIVVGTPGRMKEFIDRGVIEPRAVEIQVLDEIDRLLDGGFEGEIDAVMRPPGTCQTLCFSATISAALSRFLDRKLVPGYAEVVVAGRGGSNVGGMVEHLAYATKSGDDAVGSAVVDALEHYAGEHVDGRVGGQAIVFTETKSTAERVRAMLTNMLTTVRAFEFFSSFSIESVVDDEQTIKGFMRLESVPCSYQ